MDTYLKPTRSLPDRVSDAIEKSYSKLFFVRTFLSGDRGRANEMGVDVGLEDIACFALTVPAGLRLLPGRHPRVPAAAGRRR